VEIHFNLNLSAEKYRSYYEGDVSAMQMTSEDGRQIRFPADVLRPYLTHSYVAGRSIIQFDNNHRFKVIQKRD